MIGREPYLQKVVILRTLQLGDLLCTVPAWRALRAALPEAQISLVGLPWAKGFVERFSHILDSFIEFPGIPAFPEQEPRLHEYPTFLSEVQRRKFDLALQMQGSGQVANTLISLFGAQQMAGFYQPGCYCPDPERFLVYPEGEPEVRRHLRLMEFLGFPAKGDELEFPLFEEDWNALEGALQASGATQALDPGTYICLHPGARALDRRWPTERFSALADSLSQLGLRIVLTGTSAETEIVEAVISGVSSAARAVALNLAGKTSLGAVGALLNGARLLVSNDTGVSHIASALKTPSVVLFQASEPERWAPLDSLLHRPILNAAAASVDQVVEAAMSVIADTASHVRTREGVYGG